MMKHKPSQVFDPGPLKVSPILLNILLGLAIVGALAFLVGVFTGSVHSRQEVWGGFMVGSVYYWFLAMGALGFLAIKYVTGAKWFIAVKRLPAALGSFAWRGGFVLPFIALLGMAYIYPWVSSVHYEEIWGGRAPSYPYDGTLKSIWLSPGVHIAKTFLYIIPVVVLGFFMVKASEGPSGSPDGPAAKKRLKLSIIFLGTYIFLFSLYSWEMVMAIEPKWFSTMFGVYCFSGAFVSAMALMMMLMFVLKKQTTAIQGHHMYDMGTMVMAFSTFWIYIAFSQFMLIWYANLHDETFWYLERFQNGWWILAVIIPVLKWLIPFLLLMPPKLRVHPVSQGISCVAILVGQAVDLYWIVYPSYFDSLHMPSVFSILIFLGIGGFYGWCLLTWMKKDSIIPVNDAELASSVNGDYLHA